MKIRNKLYGISLLSLLLSVAACTGETEEMKTPDPIPSEDVGRRDVLLTLKNQLSIVPTKSGEASTKSGEIQATKAGDEIATAAENKISALDIYVFGCKTEDGVYTYQERFCYRENSSEMPSGSDVTALDLTAKGSEGKETTALLSLKKGLFVKLYCIANQGKLIDPATGAAYTDFTPLYQSNPGQTNNMVTAGVPEEDDFKLLQSVQLDPASTTDILLTPLPMTGAYATPLDLTDFSVSALLQLGFRLTRAVARFDIVNDATQSKFTIQSVSMANGRKGVSFFPLTVTGKLPDANTGELITYPARKFDGTNANAGISTGAFYIWPSPVQDGGYLILSGTYAANQTENIPVTYKIPFKPSGSETGNYIEVSQNHRYTVEITKADEYHLDFTLDVADWTDEGNIDDYEPGGDADKDGFTITPVTGDMTYDKPSRTVTMSIVDGTQFTIEGNSPTGYYTTMYYENGDLAHQWLEMDPKADNMTKADVVPSTFTVKKNAAYKGTKFPIATIRFTDKITAKETIVIVQPIANPVVKAVTHTEGSSFNDNEVLLNKTSTVTDPSVTVSVFASGGSELENIPDWLKVSPASSQTLSNAPYVFTADVSNASFPNPFPADGVTIIVKNSGDKSKTQDITIKMKSNVTVSCAVVGQAEYDTNSNAVRLYNDENAKVTLAVNSIGGTELVNKPDWLTVTDDSNKNDGKYTFYVANNGTTGVNQKVTFRNKIDNAIVSKEFTVYSNSKDMAFSAYTDNSNYSSIDNISNNTPVITYFPCENSYAEFTVISPKGITVSDPSSWAKFTTSESTFSTGLRQTKIQLIRGNGYSDASFNTFKSNLSISVTNKYDNSTKKTFTIKQYDKGIVYPGSRLPANLISNSTVNIWVAPVNASNSIAWQNSFSSGSYCPSGWRIPSVADYKNIQEHWSADNSNILYTGNAQVTVAFPDDFWSSEPGSSGLGIHTTGGKYGLWTLGQGNRRPIRCIINK